MGEVKDYNKVRLIIRVIEVRHFQSVPPRRLPCSGPERPR